MFDDLCASHVICFLGSFVVDAADHDFCQLVHSTHMVWLPTLASENHPSIPDLTPADRIAIFGGEALSIAQVREVEMLMRLLVSIGS
jgi:hypothetical protein